MQDTPSRPTALADPRERILHLRVVHGTLALHSAGCRHGQALPSGWQGLVVLREPLQCSGGEWQVRPVCAASLVKLQAFFDMSAAFAAKETEAAPWALLPVAQDVVRAQARLERWYIEQALGGAPGYHAVAHLLRQHESYGLVRFLLEQGTRSEKLNTLAQRYGVSVSHFRRLCRQALGSAAKPALRGWRTAQALLDMSLGNGSLTDVALAFGFASSSHFSKEVRELVGFAPSSLADITYLPGK
ncbi:helix-turn-helix domain-containing protein [Pseudomonas citrulli]|uniref:Helix-turn-helix domain-containing protein n=1 Tax=Pseudomonas citrulli TaxID=3064347 RepID=A0ABT9BW03_9PSED|nr:helix-turn-helix domain-containing protein [Pseudomonas sp. K18]MDO7896733.1 helix-turn-helix domain-containing protein [Pseudomonas sp. K18]